MFARFYSPIHSHKAPFRELSTPKVHRPYTVGIHHTATTNSLPPLVEELLNTPDLEAGSMTPHQMLRTTEAFWKAMKDDAPILKPPKVVHTHPADASRGQNFQCYDVCIAGGTLGIFLGLALQLRGHSICILEKKQQLQGRKQEWNINKAELQSFVNHGLLTQAELDACIITSWQYNRMAFKGGEEMYISDVLNIGVSPRILIQTAKQRFLECGGVVMEHTAFRSADVYNDCVVVHAAASAVAAAAAKEVSSTSISTRLLIDCMGHFSPIVKQIRDSNNQQPDGMVIVVGGCMEGVPTQKNTTGDLLYTFTDSKDDSQMFWEAFPAEGGRMRTAYMFMYTDAQPERQSFAAILNTYLELLPEYQGIKSSELKFKRILLGGFPCYIDSSPLAPQYDRILQVGDASAAQSPLSFGGFGSLVRHLPRLTRGIHEALTHDMLRRRDLGWLQPYQPSLSVAWLYQRSMSVRVGQLARVSSNADDGDFSKRCSAGGWLPPGHINRLLRCNFAVMKMFGDRILRPFVQDAMQCIPLGLTMLGMMIKDPVAVTTVIFQTGLVPVLRWFQHFAMLVAYTVLYRVLKPLRGAFKKWYSFQRLIDVLEVGSASDYVYVI